MRESTVESYLRREAKKVGIECRKFVTPGRRHAPDRILFLGGGVTAFVETKAPGEKPRAGQVREHKRLRKLGHYVGVCDTKEAVDAAIVILRRFKKC